MLQKIIIVSSTKFGNLSKRQVFNNKQHIFICYLERVPLIRIFFSWWNGAHSRERRVWQWGQNNLRAYERPLSYMDVIDDINICIILHIYSRSHIFKVSHSLMARFHLANTEQPELLLEILSLAQNISDRYFRPMRQMVPEWTNRECSRHRQAKPLLLAAKHNSSVLANEWDRYESEGGICVGGTEVIRVRARTGQREGSSDLKPIELQKQKE